MARFLVWDTQAINNSINEWGEYSNPADVWNTPGVGPHGENLTPVFPWNDASAYVDPLTVPPAGPTDSGAHSRPVRLFTAEGAIEHISWEFYLTGTSGDVNVCWYQEFFNDRAQPFYEPGSRNKPLPRRVPWCREQAEVVATTGLVTHVNVVRSMTMNSLATSASLLASQARAASRYFPMNVHAAWVQLRVFTMTAMAAANPNYYYDCAASPMAQRLRIFAVVGGYEQHPAMDATAQLGLPWVTADVPGPMVWDTTAPGLNATYTGTWPTAGALY